MIKKIIIPAILLLVLTSCVSRSTNCDIFDFIKRINNIYGEDIVEIDNIIASDKNILYWCPDKNTCISFYVNKKTGNIEKCNIAFENNNEKLFKAVETTLIFNNKYMKKNQFKSEKYNLLSYSDSRYYNNEKNISLKKDINEKDLY